MFKIKSIKKKRYSIEDKHYQSNKIKRKSKKKNYDL